MFTIKAYTQQGRCVIKAADSFTILRTDETGEAEITLHQKNGEGERVDVLLPGLQHPGQRPTFHWAFIENEAGRTVETIRLRGIQPGQPASQPAPASPPA